jgi:hypothetical protein
MAVLFMARRVITGHMNFSNTKYASAAFDHINAALAIYDYYDEETTITNGLVLTGTSILISIAIDDRDTAFAAATDMVEAVLSGARYATGGWSVNKI